jgi:glycosyltransferase involved in cell wall biosynthesis
MSVARRIFRAGVTTIICDSTDAHSSSVNAQNMIYILLPVHNRRPISEAFAKALSRQGVDFRLLLIDDGSTDGTADAVRAILPDRTVVLRGTGNWWWGGSLHRGWLWLGRNGLNDDDVIFICNDDIEIADDFVANGVALLSANFGSIVVAKSRNPDSGVVEETCFSMDYSRCQVVLASPGEAVACAPTRGLFTRWGDMRRIGGFHPHLIPHYLSDLEWTLRGRRRGLKILRDDKLWFTPLPDKRGTVDISALGLKDRLKNVFSVRYASNPLHWSAFILVGFPMRYWPAALMRVGLWTLGAIFRPHRSRSTASSPPRLHAP